MTIKAKKSKINLREKLAELLNFRQIRDRLDGLGLYLGKDRTGTAENVAVRGGANVDDLQLAEISAALGGTAVDVFVYDTRNDSDGGKWRERTSHTSWYNEELNTSTRGGRREFPAVAVIVAEADKVTIYDGDDPDLSMWMVFNSSGSTTYGTWLGRSSGISKASVKMLNGLLCVTSTASTAASETLIRIDFIKESCLQNATGGFVVIKNTVSNRNSSWANSYIIDTSKGGIVNIVANNDVAMTILPNALIDSDTGLPIPTIAVATDGGVSVIRDDGSVVDISNPYPMQKVSFDLNGHLHLARQEANIYYYGAIPSGDVAEFDWRAQSDVLYVGSSGADIQIGVNDIVDIVPGVIGLDDDVDSSLVRLDINKDSLPESMINFTNSRYNTGWMPGDIKLAALSDTKTETVGVDETNKLIDEQFATNVVEADFTQTYSDWGTWIGTCSVVNNKLRVIDGDGGGAAATTNFATVIGKRYIVSFDYELGTAYHLGFWIDDSSSTGEAHIYNDSNITSGSTRSVEFTATSTTTYLLFLAYGAAGSDQYGVFDNISVRQTGELITNGTFDNGTEGWTEGVSSDISFDTGRLKVLQKTGSSAYGYQLIQTQPGKKYTLTADFESGLNVGAIRVSSGDGAFNSANLYDTGYISTSFVNTAFTATTDSTYIAIQSYGATGGYVFVDNISVRLAEPDRSVNDNGLQIFGEITKTPVAPGADLVAYSGFSEDNYLMQPYNSDLDFGTGDFCVMGWVNNSSSVNSYQTYISIGKYDNTKRFFIDNNTGGLVRFVVKDDDSGVNDFEAETTCSTNSWNKFAMVRRSGIFEFYVNGLLIESNDTGANFNFNSEDGILFGVRHDTSAIAEDSSLALWRISATAPTPEQIAKIYRDERQLFTDGAQATLYGTSDAVTALAYDDKTELLHVGTSSGRSDFAGLRRINNTTTAVTTSISASNNLIAEQ